MFNIGDKLTKENYTQGAIWCNNNNAKIELQNGEYVIVAIPEPAPLTKEDVEAIRRQLYITQVDPITAHINRLRDEELTPEIAAKITKLVEERKLKVEEIKVNNPYPAEPVVEEVEEPVETEPVIEGLSEANNNEVVELYSMEI